MPGPVQGLHHALELVHLRAGVPGGRVEGVGREVADGAVAPVVGEAPRGQVLLVGDVVHGQQLHGRHAERAQVLDGLVGRQAGVGAAQVLAHGGVQLGEALHVDLVDEGLVPGRPRGAVALPVEPRIVDDALRDRVGVVGGVEHQVRVGAVGLVGEHVGRVPQDPALDGLRVGVDQQLVRVEAVALLGIPRPVHPERVPLAGPDVRQVAVPVERGALAQVHPRLAIVGVEEAQLHPLGVLGEEREVGAGPVPGRAEREGPPGPHARAHRATAADRAGSRTRPAAQLRARIGRQHQLPCLHGHLRVVVAEVPEHPEARRAAWRSTRRARRTPPPAPPAAGRGAARSSRR